MQKSLSSVIIRELNAKIVEKYKLQINALNNFPHVENIKDKLTILNYLSPISDDCYKNNYLHNDFTFKNLRFDKNITIPSKIEPSKADDESEILLRIIFDNGYLKDQNYRGFGLDSRIINPEDEQNKTLVTTPYIYKTTSIMILTLIQIILKKFIIYQLILRI
jgi:hypothetical protein